jgi:acyl dehydratase
MTVEEIKAFASQFDPQPFHLDEAAAEASFFKGLAASGWHTAAVTMRLLVTSGLTLAGGLIGAGGELTWPKPVRPGDVLTVESEVLDLQPSKSKPERGLVTMRSRTLNQRSEVVQDMTTRMLVWKRPA